MNATRRRPGLKIDSLESLDERLAPSGLVAIRAVPIVPAGRPRHRPRPRAGAELVTKRRPGAEHRSTRNT